MPTFQKCLLSPSSVRLSCTSETSVYYETRRYNIPECCHLNERRCTTLQSRTQTILTTAGKELVFHDFHCLQMRVMVKWLWTFEIAQKRFAKDRESNPPSPWGNCKPNILFNKKEEFIPPYKRAVGGMRELPLLLVTDVLDCVMPVEGDVQNKVQAKWRLVTQHNEVRATKAPVLIFQCLTTWKRILSKCCEDKT
jgi:hypothetical protein